jgi:tRNA A37 threonylcarbamoyladenosine dehydratase
MTDMKIGIIGCGGIGSRLVQALASSLGVDNLLVIVDPDTFEEKNTARQVFNHNLIGIPKVYAMKQMYSGLIEVEAHHDGIYDELDMRSYFFDCDVVFISPDNNRARKVAIQWCMDNDIPFINTGNTTEHANSIFWSPLVRDLSHGTIDPFKVYPDILKGQDAVRGMSCMERVTERPQTSHANQLAATTAMHLFRFWFFTKWISDHSLVKEVGIIEFVCGPGYIRQFSFDNGVVR